MRGWIVGLIVGAVGGLAVGVFGLGQSGSDEVADTATDTIDTGPSGAAVKLKMASAFGSQWPIQGDLAMRLVDRVDVVSGGNLKIQFFEPGALVPPLEMFDAVSSGAIDAGFTTAGYWAGKIPADLSPKSTLI